MSVAPTGWYVTSCEADRIAISARASSVTDPNLITVSWADSPAEVVVRLVDEASGGRSGVPLDVLGHQIESDRIPGPARDPLGIPSPEPLTVTIASRVVIVLGKCAVLRQGAGVEGNRPRRRRPSGELDCEPLSEPLEYSDSSSVLDLACWLLAT